MFSLSIYKTTYFWFEPHFKHSPSLIWIFIFTFISKHRGNFLGKEKDSQWKPSFSLTFSTRIAKKIMVRAFLINYFFLLWLLCNTDIYYNIYIWHFTSLYICVIYIEAHTYVGHTFRRLSIINFIIQTSSSKHHHPNFPEKKRA